MSRFDYVRCSTGDYPPAHAVKGGFDGGPSYHARGIVNGKMIPGKVGTRRSGNPMIGACIPYGNKENRIHDFEVLTSLCEVNYVHCRTGDHPPKNAVPGGYDGGESYHARGTVNGKLIPGKVGVNTSGGTLVGACIAYGNKEHRIHDFEVLVIDPDKIIHVDFDVDHGKLLHSTPKVIAKQTLNNDTSREQSMEFSYNEQVSTTSSFQHTAGVEITVGTSFQCGVPCLAEGKIEVGVTASYQHSWGKSETTSKSYTGKVPVRTNKNTAVVCKAIIKEAKLEVPYKIHFESGRTSSGIWHGVSTWDFHVTFDERKK